MDIHKSFVENYSFIEKEHSWIDPESFINQKQLVGGYPIHKILKNNTEKYKQLENYGIPAGLVLIPKTNNRFFGGKPIHSIKKNENLENENKEDINPIKEDDHTRLFNLINIYKNKNSKTKKNHH